MSTGRSEPEPMWSLLLLCGLIAIICAVFWHYCKMPILEFLRWVRLGELYALTPLTHVNDNCIDWLRHAQFNDTNPSYEAMARSNKCFGSVFIQNYIQTAKPDDKYAYYGLSGTSMAEMERRVSIYLKWPVAVGFALVGIYAIFFSPRNKFRTQYTLETFIKLQAKMWPVISPIVNFNPIRASARPPGSQVPDKLPIFAEALSPEEWISWHRISVTNGIPDREAARRAFLLQLGPRWNGINGLPSHIQALYAAFALKGVQKREESDDLLGRLAECWSHKGGFKMTPKVESEVRSILRDPDIGGRALDIAAKHAYRTTAILALLRWARSMGGVLAPAQFLWVRATDRALWYPLNNLGRRSYHTEGAGAIAHFMAEENAKKPLPIPRIDTAIVTLNLYMAKTDALPIPPHEGDNAAKKGART